MRSKFRRIRTITILSLQLFCFWLAVGYVSCLFISSLPATAQDMTNSVPFTMPHGPLFLYAEITTAASLALAMLIGHVQQRTSKLKLIRLYRPRTANDTNNKKLINK